VTIVSLKTARIRSVGDNAADPFQLLPPLKMIQPAATITCENVAVHPDFRALVSIANLRVDLRYASAANFMGRDMYSPLDCAWVHRDAAAGLARAVAWLARQRPHARLCVLDALRPQRVQEAMWAALEGTPLTAYLAPPERGSIHSFGMAIDATLIDVDNDGEELDMGTSFDDMTELSHPALEIDFLKTGALDAQQISNRHLLRNAMQHGGFHGINTEWWHFDCGDRALVRASYARVL
jgi:zinc D-Ala-D-Ala dipeptidase